MQAVPTGQSVFLLYEISVIGIIGVIGIIILIALITPKPKSSRPNKKIRGCSERSNLFLFARCRTALFSVRRLSSRRSEHLNLSPSYRVIYFRGRQPPSRFAPTPSPPPPKRLCSRQCIRAYSTQSATLSPHRA